MASRAKRFGEEAAQRLSDTWDASNSSTTPNWIVSTHCPECKIRLMRQGQTMMSFEVCGVELDGSNKTEIVGTSGRHKPEEHRKAYTYIRGGIKLVDLSVGPHQMTISRFGVRARTRESRLGQVEGQMTDLALEHGSARLVSSDTKLSSSFRVSYVFLTKSRQLGSGLD